MSWRFLRFSTHRAAGAFWTCVFWLLAGMVAPAALTTNAPIPIDRRLTVQVIQVETSSGTNPAPLFGSASAQLAIFNGIDQIWAQAGIDVEFKFRLTPYLDTFALTGTAGSNNPRPTSDLNTIFQAAKTAGGILDPNPKVLNLFMVQIVPGFSQQDANTANGLSFVGANGITLWAGSALPTFAGGQEVISAVLAHEIGHNLGLNHIVNAENLMQAGGSANEGERLIAAQITTARGSTFLTVIPEPGVGVWLVMGGVVALVRRQRQPHGRSRS